MPSNRALAAMIDHTLLRADATAAQIDQLVHEARTARFAAVCVNPAWVARAHAQLGDSEVGVCTVIGFPLGASSPTVKAFEAREALAAGAGELDMVLAVGAFLGGDQTYAAREVAKVARLCHAHGAVLKVILETGLLSDKQIVDAARIAVESGADFVKTSTGFGPRGATVHDITLLRAEVGPDVGVKASGGIRSRDEAQQLLDAGANRIGTSAGPQIVG